MKFDVLKSKAKQAIGYAEPHAKSLSQKAKECLVYAKDNPQDAMLAVLTVCGIHQSAVVEDIEDNTEVSAIVDIHEFMGS